MEIIINDCCRITMMKVDLVLEFISFLLQFKLEGVRAVPARAYVMCGCRSKQWSNDRPLYA